MIRPAGMKVIRQGSTKLSLTIRTNMDAEENAQSEGNANNSPSSARLALTPPDEKRSEMVNECSSPLSPYKKGRYAETSQGGSHRDGSERTPN